MISAIRLFAKSTFMLFRFIGSEELVALEVELP